MTRKLAMMMLAFAMSGCANQLQLVQETFGGVVPYAESEGEFYARASIQHVYADARGGARLGLHIYGLGQVWEICRESARFLCDDRDDADPGVAGEWVYDIVIWEDGEGRRRIQMRPTDPGQIPAVRTKLGIPAPTPMSGSGAAEQGSLPESPVFALPVTDPDIPPPPPPPQHRQRM